MALANVMSNAARTAFEMQFASGLLAGDSGFFSFGGLYTDKTQVKEVQALMAGGAWSTISSTTDDGDITPEAVYTGKASFNRADFSVKHRFTVFDWNNLVASLEGNGQAEIAAQLGKMAQQKLADVGYTGLLAMSATNHPMAGASAQHVGAGLFWLDTSLIYRQGLAGQGTQDTLMVQGLSADSYAIARANMRKLRTITGLRLNGGMGRVALVCGLDDERLAQKIVGSPILGLDNAINPLQGTAFVVATPHITDGEWYLIDVDAAPIGVWVPEPPTVEALQISTSHYEIGVNMSAKFVGRPYAEGIIGSEP